MHFLTVDSWYCFQLRDAACYNVKNGWCTVVCSTATQKSRLLLVYTDCHHTKYSLLYFKWLFFRAHRDLSVNPSPPGTDPVHPVGEDAAFSHFCVSWAEGEK